jgi:uncharacterized protein YrrD
MSMETMSIKELTGLTVISIADGMRVGAINRVYADPAAKRIVGISVEPGSSLLEPDSRKLIDVKDIHSLGPDAVTVSDASVVRGDETNERWLELIDVDGLTKQKVVTESGEVVGSVSSVEFDKGSYQLSGIEASPGFFKSNTMIPIHQVTTIGPEMIIVSDEVCAPKAAAGEETTVDESRWVVEETAEDRGPEVRTEPAP